MNFTRDPIIETIITARDGHKILIRDVNLSHDEHYVDMLEVIRMGEACFYRSLEKPKPFIVPAAHFELIEVREPRVALKAPLTVEKGIKIAPSKEAKEEELSPKPEKKKEKKRTRKRKERAEKSQDDVQQDHETEPEVVMEPRTLIPPPSTLISETLSKYKNSSAIEELALEAEYLDEEADDFIEESSDLPENEEVFLDNSHDFEETEEAFEEPDAEETNIDEQQTQH